MYSLTNIRPPSPERSERQPSFAHSHPLHTVCRLRPNFRSARTPRIRCVSGRMFSPKFGALTRSYPVCPRAHLLQSADSRPTQRRRFTGAVIARWQDCGAAQLCGRQVRQCQWHAYGMHLLLLVESSVLSRESIRVRCVVSRLRASYGAPPMASGERVLYRPRLFGLLGMGDKRVSGRRLTGLQ